MSAQWNAMRHLVAALRDPTSVTTLDGDGWSALISVARAEVLLGTLAQRVAGQAMPPEVAALLGAARIAADQAQVQALWEAVMCARALAPLNVRWVLLKGTAYASAGLSCAAGRQIGDLDILVPRDRLAEVETALLAAGWEWVKDDPYDQAYYRDHMHELPPLIHGLRDRMIDVHHTILPLTARPRPDAAAMIADAVLNKPSLLQGGGLGGGLRTVSATTIDPTPSPRLEARDSNRPEGEGGVLASPSPLKGGGLYTLSPHDMLIHCAAHMMADGDLAGGLRNLWDIHCLLSEFGDDSFWSTLKQRAHHHQLWFAVHRAARLSHHLYGTPIPLIWQGLHLTDRLFLRRLMARDDWGRETKGFTRLAFYIRSHLLRMPPLMLARHLWTKWRTR